MEKGLEQCSDSDDHSDHTVVKQLQELVMYILRFGSQSQLDVRGNMELLQFLD